MASKERHIMPRERLMGDWNGDIEFVVLPHNEQRYDTAGDWSFAQYFPHLPESGETLVVSISDVGDKFDSEIRKRMNLCLFIHELNEALLFMGKHGFTRESVEIVDNWDKDCIQEEVPGEPGGDPECPYFTEHMTALCAENMALAHFGINNNDYTNAIAELDYTQPDPRDPQEPNQ